MLSTSSLIGDFSRGVEERLSRGQRVRRRLPAGGGRLHIDRQVPFLCVHRRHPEEVSAAPVERFVTSQASYLQAELADTLDPGLPELVGTIARHAQEELGAFLLLELWEEPEAEAHDGATPHLLRPRFALVRRAGSHPGAVAAALREALEGVRLGRRRGEVREQSRPEVAPPGLGQLLPPAPAMVSLGLVVAPVYRDPEGQELPMVLLRLEEQLREVLERAFFAFSRQHTRLRVPHYRALGRRTLAAASWNVDRRLEAVSRSFDLLLQVNPVNSEQAWERFREAKFREAPRFFYRPLPFDPHQLKRSLFDIPIERVEDPVLARLFREKQEELDRQVSLLADRGSRRFLYGSLLLYGGVEEELLRLAERLLSRLPSHQRDDDVGGHVDAEAFARCARLEIAAYRRSYPAFRAEVHLRRDLPAGAMVSRDRLLVGATSRFPRSRVEALLHHEVGTHLLTYFNGRAQRIRLFHAGFAGYEVLQEGLAVLGEYAAGGLSRPRLRTLAGRVVACHDLVEGTSFVDCFRRLTEEHGFPERSAFLIALRLYRGGGLTKDAIYLRGLWQLVGHLRRGGELEPLLVGKIALRHLPAMEDLGYRNFFRPAAILPRYLASRRAQRRIAELRNAPQVMDVLAEAGLGTKESP